MRMVNKPLTESFIIREANDYAWPKASCNDLGKRKDNNYRNTAVK